MKFKKKPVVIDAYPASELIELNRTDYEALPECIKEAYEKTELMFTPKGIEIQTLEGWHHANADDMVICGIKGELYSCRMDIFEITYEKVENA